MMLALVATARRLDADVDLVAFGGGPGGVLWSRYGSGFAGQGTALRVDIPGAERAQAAKLVHEALAAVTLADGFGPSTPRLRAVGALPFDPAADATLFIPAVTIVRAADGTRWALTVDGGDDLPELHAPAEPEAPSVFQVRAVRSPAWWRGVVAQAVERINQGELRKVVLAREIEVIADTVIDARAPLRRLNAVYPSCYLAAVDGFLCASPELLVSRQGDVVRAQPMAGTAPRVGDPAADARLAAGLLGNASHRSEHRFTIDMVHDTLLPWCSYLDSEPEPQVIAVANVQHLATMVEGRLSRPEPSVLELVAALHPTPAVGGDPRTGALELQAEIEGLDRRRYGGPVGWVDAEGNGEWAVGIRSAELDGPVAHLYAGNGIVAGSVPDLEYAETQAKFQAMLSALIRP